MQSGVFACSWAWPASGLAAANAGLQNLTTTGIFVISGLGLRRGEVRACIPFRWCRS